MSLRALEAEDVAAGLDVVAAADALEAALRDGLDPEADPPRTSVALGRGELLVMPSTAGGHVACKLLTTGGDRIQGTCVVFDPETLAPTALVDGAALTLLRTPAVSLLAVRAVCAPDPRRAVVLGRGLQGVAHAAALRAGLPSLERIDLLGRDVDEDLLAAADVVICATSSPTPLFDSGVLAAQATVVAMGAHDPGRAEVDDALVARATVVVESRASAAREAGAVRRALASGALTPEALVPLADVARGTARIAPDRPRLVVTTGMSWEDAVVAGALVHASG